MMQWNMMDKVDNPNQILRLASLAQDDNLRLRIVRKLSNGNNCLRQNKSKISNQKGASLVELLLVVVVISFIVILMANLPNAFVLIGRSRHLSLAREIVTKEIEDKKATEYINLVNGTTPISDPRLSQLPGSTGEVVVEDCSTQICTNMEDVKQLTVTINWTDGGKDQTVSFKTLIGRGGLNQ